MGHGQIRRLQRTSNHSKRITMTKGFDFAFNDTATRLQSVNDDDIKAEHPPLTKREYFAAMAMQGLCALLPDGTATSIAKESVIQADALINALNKQHDLSTIVTHSNTRSLFRI